MMQQWLLIGVGGERSGSSATMTMALQPSLNAIHVNVNDRRRKKGEHLAQDESADNGDTQRTTKFRADTGAKSKGKRTQERRHGGHHDGPEAQQTSLINGVKRGLAFQTLRLDREIDHENSVFLDDADQQDDANERDDIEIGLGELHGQQCADARGRERRKNGDGVDEALVENAEHDIDGEERGDNQYGLVGQRVLKGLGSSLKSGVDAARDAELALRLDNVLHRGSKRSAGSKIEGKGK